MKRKILKEHLALIDSDFFKNYKLLFIVSLLITLFFGSIFAKSIRPCWKSTAVMKVGQIAGTYREYFSPESIEQTYLRMSSPQFIRSAISKSSLPTSDKTLIESSFHFEQKLDSNTFKISLKASSPENSKLGLLLLVKKIHEYHQAQMEPKIDLLKRRLTVLKEEESTVNQFFMEIKSNLHKLDKKTSLLLLTSLENIKFEKNQNITEMEDKLSPFNTFPTDIVHEIIVEPKPIMINKKVIYLASFLIGFINALLLSISHKILRQNRLFPK